LSQGQQQAVHNAIAARILADRRISIADTNVVLTHALLGKSNLVLAVLARSVLTAAPEIGRELREWFFLLRSVRTDRLIYPESPAISRMLRLAQFKLIAEGNDGEEISACAAAVLSEGAAANHDQELNAAFEVLALGTILGTIGIAEHLANWIDLILRMKAA